VRVLCLSTDYPPARSGGYELQCQAFVEHLERHGHQTRVLTSAELPRFPAVPRPTSTAAAWRDEQRAATVLAGRVREFRPDVVSFWRLGELSMSLVERVRRAGLPAVGMVCDPWMVEGPRRDPWARRGARPRFAGAARWLFVSRALHREVLAAGVETGRVDIVPWGVDLAAFPLAPARPARRRLLYVGRLSRLKGVDLAVRALAHLPGVALDVVGDGDPGYVQELRTLAGVLGVGGRVRFHGAQPRPAVAAAYAQADALLFPVRWQEPFGAVPLEAMARGMPVIATSTGGSAEFLHDGLTALVVPPEDPQAVAAAARRVLAEPALRRRLRSAGRRMAERYPAERSHERVRRALEAAAIDRRNPARRVA
jgi:glycosyltransferase involved in cell wall biosynthesis